MKGCICNFAKWQIHPLISKGGDLIRKKMMSQGSHNFAFILSFAVKSQALSGTMFLLTKAFFTMKSVLLLNCYSRD